MSRTAAKKSRAAMLAELETDQSAEIERAAIVRGATTQPVTFRASAPLIEALDRLAEADHRTRANLIQHILWQYVQSKEHSKT